MSRGDERRQNKAAVDNVDQGYASYYETDSIPPSNGRRSRTKLLKKKKSFSAGYETDDGYASAAPTTPKKSKSRIFRLGTRSKTNLHEPSPPPLPEPLPVFRLPIAARFATTLGDLNAGANTDPPLPPPVRPFVSTDTSTISSTPSPSIATFNGFREFDRDSIDNPESTVDHGVAQSVSHSTTSHKSTRRVGVNFASSDSSDHHGSSSTNHSFFSKLTASSFASSTSQNKYPPISYPLTRSPSPPSPTLIQRHQSGNKRIPEPLYLDNVGRGPSKTWDTSPVSAGGWSPYVNIPSIAPSVESLHAPSPSKPRPYFLSRRVNSPTPGAGPSLTPKYSVSDSGHLAVNEEPRPPSNRSGASGEVIPSMDYIVPSPRSQSPLPLQPPPTHLLSHHELPPPSPPPTVPLPRVPSDQDQGYFATQQRQNGQFAVAPPSVPKRGKEAPFPARPINTLASQPGLEARVKVKRYRDLYALPNRWDEEQPSSDDTEVMRDVIARFQRTSGHSSSGEDIRVALDRNQSPEAMHRNNQTEDYDSDGYSRYPEENKSVGRSTMYRLERGAVSTGRLSTWSGDSRASIMDLEKSEVARQRFVKRIEAMFDQNGRELPGSEIPPVPRLPEGLSRRRMPLRF
ncbi:uncharacterized protein BT62DRAFT_1079611 [Guyanagaster necrorhizus]|uniref:Uncharacterized protein n=1 Tax=Guyanagaster necrorhizus TaxID=856835 RepID=A0A9P7VK33_9AGAR|nr:uncharacterized protein BT62DRAFT_1079611 [Guyanagaster necrorhizus MCA 3950]KAG7442082.1 hypothetical protein BT62DRAFT_1079611 [Guyanagaster necrorhizus MCA 3950]